MVCLVDEYSAAFYHLAATALTSEHLSLLVKQNGCWHMFYELNRYRCLPRQHADDSRANYRLIAF